MSCEIIGRLLVASGTGKHDDCLMCELSNDGEICIESCCGCDGEAPCHKYNDGEAYFINDEGFKESK